MGTENYHGVFFIVLSFTFFFKFVFSLAFLSFSVVVFLSFSFVMATSVLCAFGLRFFVVFVCHGDLCVVRPNRAEYTFPAVWPTYCPSPRQCLCCCSHAYRFLSTFFVSFSIRFRRMCIGSSTSGAKGPLSTLHWPQANVVLVVAW